MSNVPSDQNGGRDQNVPAGTTLVQQPEKSAARLPQKEANPALIEEKPAASQAASGTSPQQPADTTAQLPALSSSEISPQQPAGLSAEVPAPSDQPSLGQSAESSSTRVSAQPLASSSAQVSALSSDQPTGELSVQQLSWLVNQMKKEQERKEQERKELEQELEQERKERKEREQELEGLKASISDIQLNASGAHETVSQFYKTLHNF